MVIANTPNTKDFLKKQIEEHTDKTKCTIIPLPCGAGKSSFIRELVTAKHGKGMIVVTDKITSAQDYLKVYDDETGEYIKLKSNRVVLLTHENISETLPLVNHRPIVIMTFKRYFSMTIEEIRALSVYQHGKRELVIFDEKPPIEELFTIGIHTLTDVFADLYNAITDTANQADKFWIVSQVEYFIDRYKILLDTFEGYSNYPEFYFFFRDTNQTISDDDKRFYEIVEQYKAEINKNNFDTIQTIRKIKYMLEHGALFRCQKVGAGAGDYIKDFNLIIDNTKKIVDVGMKAFVFDATGEYANEYDRGCFEIVECNQFRRNLEPLTIDVVNVNTSRYALTRKTNKDAVIQTMIDEIKAEKSDDAIVFTYKAIERQFAEYVRNTAHFGDIRGRNDLKASRYFQIGLNRLPTHMYLLMLSMCEEYGYVEEYQHYFNLDPKEQIEIFHKKTQAKNMDDDIKYVFDRAMLEDIEQNIMRSTLRDNSNTEPVHYTLHFDTTEMRELCDIILFRFGVCGASVEVLDKPLALQLLQTKTRKAPQGKKETNAQKILRFIDGLQHGETFKVSDMLKTIGLSNQQWRDAKKDNKALAQRLNQMQTETKGYYKKC